MREIKNGAFFSQSRAPLLRTRLARTVCRPLGPAVRAGLSGTISPPPLFMRARDARSLSRHDVAPLPHGCELLRRAAPGQDKAGRDLSRHYEGQTPRHSTKRVHIGMSTRRRWRRRVEQGHIVRLPGSQQMVDDTYERASENGKDHLLGSPPREQALVAHAPLWRMRGSRPA
jgi:hypothetical protein